MHVYRDIMTVGAVLVVVSAVVSGAAYICGKFINHCLCNCLQV